MVSLGRRLAERSADVLDWIDYRPDADFRFLLVLPPMLSVAWAYGGFVGLGVLLAFAVLVTLLVASLLAMGVAAWIVANALLDVAPPLRLPAPSGRRASI